MTVTIKITDLKDIRDGDPIIQWGYITRQGNQIVFTNDNIKLEMPIEAIMAALGDEGHG